jgi:hypothetical protein
MIGNFYIVGSVIFLTNNINPTYFTSFTFFPRRKAGQALMKKVTKKSSPPGPTPFGQDCRKKAKKFEWQSEMKSVTALVQGRAFVGLTGVEYFQRFVTSISFLNPDKIIGTGCLPFQFS